MQYVTAFYNLHWT